jgi:photosystem II stability/assembly factor-like uncharacterized protein
VLWVQHHCGLYRSTNGGQHWAGIAARAPSGFGFAVACDPVNPQRAWFVPAVTDPHRYAVDGNMVLNRTDAGEQWHCISRDLPPVAALGWVVA